MCLFSTLSNAQRPGHGGGSSSPLISNSLTTYWNLTPAEQAFYNEAISLPNVTGSKIIELGNVTALQTDGEITFTIPALDLQSSATTVTAKASLIEYENANEYSWTGKIDGGGTMNLISRPGGQGGFIHLPNNDFYSIFRFPSGGGKAMLLQHSDSIEAVCGLENSNKSSSNGPCELPPDDCPAIIDILVLFSQDIPYSGPFVTVIIGSLMEATTNLAFVNSGIINKQVRIKFEFDYNLAPNAENDIHFDLQRLISDPEAQELRAANRGDIVVLLTDRGYTRTGTFFPIFGTAGDTGAPNSLAYAIVEAPFIFAPRWTFAHEIAHILGAHHEDNEFNDCGRGFIINTPPLLPTPTILGPTAAQSPGDAGTRILHYSNPDVFFSSEATGDVDHNNALVIRNSACTTAEFQPAWEWNALIGGSDVICDEEGDPVELRAIVFDGISGFPSGLPPYTYQWAWSRDGVNIEAFIGNNETLSFNAPCYPCLIFFVHLEVTSSNSFVSKTIKKIDIDYFDCFVNDIPTDRSHENSSISLLTNEYKEALYSIFPNPSFSGKFNISAITSNVDLSSDITVFNATGILVSRYRNINLTDYWELNLSQQQKGIYFVKINSGKTIETIKIINL